MTGRDAAWLASRGLEVIIIAVEPSGAMRAEAASFALDPMDRLLLPMPLPHPILTDRSLADIRLKLLNSLARPKRFELPTPRFVVCCPALERIW